ncbi:MAG: chemotaxis protein CheW [Bacteriovoracaceae bacterium]
MNAPNFLNEFLIESNENLSTINDDLISFGNSRDKDTLNHIYRSVHTLKGSAGFLGFKNLQKITHLCENILDLLRDQKLSVTESLIDGLLQAFDVVVEALQLVESEGNDINVDVKTITPVLEDILSAKQSQSVEDSTNPLDEKPRNFEGFVLKKEEGDGDLGPSSKTQEVKLSEPLVKEGTEEEATQKKMPEKKVNVRTVADSVVRVNVALLDKIMNLVGELVLSRNQILQYSNNLQDGGLGKLSHDLNVITSELQTEIMNTRMQPASNVLNKFERLIRDLSKSQGKKIKINITGKETELDRTLLEAIKDPLTHIIRNSIDHGIELPEDRLKVQKSEVGQIFIRAYQESGYVAIEIEDDGKGLDSKRILKKAIEKGLTTESQASKLDEATILNFIFNPGFSTAQKVTNISGRGVGMDVVKTNIEKIGGNVSISSKVGKGAKFKLKIPLTLAIIPALMVRVNESYFSIPQINLQELVKTDTDKKVIEKIKDSEFFRLRNELIPIIRLNDALELSHDESDKPQNESSSPENIIVLRVDQASFGLVVDEILDTEEIVVKPLDQNLKKINVFAGATLMGDGTVALIVDPMGIWQRQGNELLKSIDTQSQDYGNDRGNAFAYDEGHEILLCALEDKNTYGIPISMVHRLEEFPVSKISKVGESWVVQYNGQPMPLVTLESSLGLNQKPLIHKLKENSHKDEVVETVVVNFQGQMVGILVTEIVDILFYDEEIKESLTVTPFSMGHFFVDEKVMTLIDCYQMVKSLFPNMSSINQGALKVLVVEDSHFYRNVVIGLLGSLGLEVHSFENGKEAWANFQNNDYDLVITDVEMPHMTGFELSENIRKINSDIPIIAITTRVSDSDLKHGKEVGFTHYLEKLNREQVETTVKYYIEKFEQLKAAQSEGVWHVS